MATPNIAPNLSGLALRLVRDKLLSPADAERLQNEAQLKKTAFVTQLVDSKKLDSGTIAPKRPMTMPPQNARKAICNDSHAPPSR